MMRILQHFSLFMGLLFLLAAGVQWNDPDPIRWMTVYGAAAFASLFFWRKLTAWQFPALVGLLTLIWALTLMPGALADAPPAGEVFAEFEMADQRVEVLREMIGLLIVAGWMLLIAIVQRRKSERK